MTGRLLGPTTCLPHKDGDISLIVLPKDTTSKLAGLLSTLSQFCWASNREAMNTICKSLLVWVDLGNEPQVYWLWNKSSNHYSITPVICVVEIGIDWSIVALTIAVHVAWCNPTVVEMIGQHADYQMTKLFWMVNRISLWATGSMRFHVKSKKVLIEP